MDGTRVGRARLIPQGATPDARRLVIARGLRGFVDGIVSVLLASYLSDLGFSPGEIGIIITGTLLGSAALTLGVGLLGYRLSPRGVLLGASGLAVVTGLGFAGFSDFWPLLLVAIAGTMNPSSGDVSVFLPTEQALLSRTIPDARRTQLFAVYNLSGTLLGAAGALVSGVPVLIARNQGWDLVDAQRVGFALYAVVGVVNALLYLRLSPAMDEGRPKPGRSLATSRAFVLRLSAVFSLDSFGGGFAVQSLLALWLFRRFDLSVETTGVIFFVSGVLSAFSQLLAARIAERIGLIRTMVYTHIPANLLLAATAFMPTAPLAIACLLARMAFAQMDVPARQSYVMAMVPPEERTAAATVTNVPRSLVSAFAPALGGWLLAQSDFGWPLVLAGLIKVAYDVILLALFRNARPADEISRIKT